MIATMEDTTMTGAMTGAPEIPVIELVQPMPGFPDLARFTLVRVDDTGYQVRFVRGAGVRSARWTDVEDLTTTEVAGSDCVQFRLRDGRTTTVPVDLVAGDREEFVRELRNRLDAGHGYKRL